MFENGSEYPILELKFRSEEELLGLVKQKLEQIEPGLSIIKEKKLSFEDEDNYYLLANDQKNRFVLVAVRIFEDENWFYQIIDHYEWFKHYMRRWQDSLPQNERYNINLKEGRLILVAPTFPDSMIKCLPYLTLSVSLYEYRYLKVGFQQGLLLNPVKEKIEQVEEAFDVNISSELKPLYHNLIRRISGLDPGLVNTYGKNHVDLIFKGQPLGQIRFGKNFFWVDTGLGSWYSICVEDEKSLEEAWEKIRLVFLHLGGKEVPVSDVENPHPELTQEEINELSK